MYGASQSKALLGILVGLFVASSLGGLAVEHFASGLAVASPGGSVTPAAVPPASLQWRFYDFFKTPYGEFWDYRFDKYGDLPMNAECFNATSIADLICPATNASVPDVPSYPYTNWYPLPGALTPGDPGNDPMIYAPYRLSAAASYIPGYNLSEPVFLPVLKYGLPRGNRLDFTWNMQYLDRAAARAAELRGCGRIIGLMDGFIIRSQVTLTMDIQESKRMFGVVATTPSEAQGWWNVNALSGCLTYGPLEDAIEQWFVTLGNTKYDVANSFEYFYAAYWTDMKGTVDPVTGLTTVTIDHAAWGTEVLLARMFYWGNVSYQQNYLDSTKRKGWWGMELAWFEDFRFLGSLGSDWVNFTLNSIMQYHFQFLADPGPNGIYDRTDDVPYWGWGPVLTDYTNDWSPVHLISELDRYPNPPYQYVHSTPGAPSTFYGKSQPYDYAPITWNLLSGESWRFEFPTGNVVFYDPNLTPLGANPRKAQYVALSAPFAYRSTNPASYGTWTEPSWTWTVTGPTSTGGPVGSPGADRTPGTSDDAYALEPWGSISLKPGITVSIQGPWRQLYAGQTMDLSVAASFVSNPLPGATVAATLTGAGTLTPMSGTTDSSGKFKTTVQGSTAGTSITVTATASLAGYVSGTSSYAIGIVDGQAMTMVVSSNRREMMGNELATIRVNLTSGLAGVTGALLTPSTPVPGSKFSPVRELGSGNYEFGWTPPNLTRQTFVPINVLGKAGGYFDTTGRVTILVDPNKTNPDNPTQLFLLVRSPATSLSVGQTLTITVYVYTIEGYVVSGATLTLLRVGPGTVSAVTDRLNGEYTFVYTAPASVPGPTGVLITITASKFGYANGTARLALTVIP